MRLGELGLVAVALLVGAAAIASCSTSAAPHAPSAPKMPGGFLANCSDDAECESHLCGQSGCTLSCTQDSDCDDGEAAAAARGGWRFVCGVGSNSEHVCVPPCFSSGYACVNGVSTSCQVLDQTQCLQCGCGGFRCEPGVGCLPVSDVGGNCVQDSDCRSQNCGRSGVCRLPVGSACDTTNCDVCLQSGAWSYCSRHCDGGQCGNSGRCIFDRLGSTGYCLPTCLGARDTCRNGVCSQADPTDDHSWFCRCDCPHVGVKLDTGRLCNENAECKSDLCDAILDTTLGIGVAPQIGRCTTVCATSQDCQAGYRCATAGGFTRCIPSCDNDCIVGAYTRVGRCAPLTTVEGDTPNLCWAAYSSDPCRLFSDCQSGQCGPQGCVAAGSVTNGQSCTADNDCASRSCADGLCHGTAGVGAACMAHVDCALGTICCPDGALVNTCQLACNQ